MNQNKREVFLQALLSFLSGETHLSFAPFYSFDYGASKRRIPERVYLSPAHFHFSQSDVRDDRRVGFLIEMPKRRKPTGYEIKFGFEIVHNSSAGMNLRKFARTNRHFITHLVSKMPGAKVEASAARSDKQADIAYFESKNGDVFMRFSGRGRLRSFDRRRVEDWIELFDSYPWDPPAESKTVGAKSYFTIKQVLVVKLSKASFDDDVRFIGRNLIARYMPLLSASASSKGRKIMPSRLNGSKARSAFKSLYPDGFRCAVHQERDRHIKICHIVPERSFRKGTLKERQLANSPANNVLLCGNCHDDQEKTEKWYVRGRGIYRGDGPRKGQRVRLRLAPEHRKMLRDLRPLAQKLARKRI